MKDDELPLPTGCHLRGGVYHLRIGLPDDLKPHYPRTKSGKLATDAFRESLKTSERTTAVRLAHAKIAEVQADFERVRRELKPQKLSPTSQLVAELCERIRHTVLYEDDERRAAGQVLAGIPVLPDDFGELSDDPYERADQIADACEVWAGALTQLNVIGDFRMAEQFAKFETDAMGLPPVDWAGRGPELSRVARELARAYADVARRSRGEDVETPPTPKTSEQFKPAPALSEEPPLFLEDVVPTWTARNRPKEDAIKRTRKALTHFEAAVGRVGLRRLTKAHGSAFVTYLLDRKARGFGDSTAANHAAAINALLNAAVKADLIERNPFDLKFEVRDAQEREEWTNEELTRLYGSALFKDPGEFPVLRSTDPTEAYFALLILLFTGARIGEVAQLEVADVIVRNGIHALSIHRKAGTVKTAASVRNVPIAGDLVALGLVEFAEAQRQAGAIKLFPSLHRGKTSPGDVLGKWFRQPA
ncbi:phage integrase SAM-like domain-containing protein [Variovorax sp. LjRoot130]|uniref:DUF6538 domain-containing protein n=1 Tax=Variovorax sp. LjRoot130 TaxID=3342261 RepID=UPI003ECDCFCA